MEEERVLETTTVTGGERPQVEGRRRTLSNDHAPQSRKGLDNRMETPKVQQRVRRKPGNEESGRPIRDNMDVEGGALDWIFRRERRRSSSAHGRDEKDIYGDSPLKAPNIEERQRGRPSGATAK